MFLVGIFYVPVISFFFVIYYLYSNNKIVS
nr:MAG TPA: hypothetical protein [Caudoviricetes sp.]